jgi:hypothetical protein
MGVRALFILLFSALAPLSLRYGHDSRDGVWSKEQELALFA